VHVQPVKIYPDALVADIGTIDDMLYQLLPGVTDPADDEGVTVSLKKNCG